MRRSTSDKPSGTARESVSQQTSLFISNQPQEDVYEMMAMPDRYRVYLNSV